MKAAELPLSDLQAIFSQEMLVQDKLLAVVHWSLLLWRTGSLARLSSKAEQRVNRARVPPLNVARERKADKTIGM
jgi:hypothetical protein